MMCIVWTIQKTYTLESLNVLSSSFLQFSFHFLQVSSREHMFVNALRNDVLWKVEEAGRHTEEAGTGMSPVRWKWTVRIPADAQVTGTGMLPGH